MILIEFACSREFTISIGSAIMSITRPWANVVHVCHAQSHIGTTILIIPIRFSYSVHTIVKSFIRSHQYNMIILFIDGIVTGHARSLLFVYVKRFRFGGGMLSPMTREQTIH